MEKFSFLKKEKISKLPETAGVYAFRNGSLLYIGKAKNIKKRVKGHFSQPSWRDNLFADKVKEVGFIKTDSEIEALILEAGLIKKHLPKYNVLWKDDKNYFYVKIDRGYLPYVSLTHQPIKKAEYIGPFIEGSTLKKTLKILRRIFPYYTKKSHPKRLCSFCHLDLCPGPNPDLKEYQKNLRRLKDVLKGKRKSVVRGIRKEMEEFSKKQEYEKAAELRDKIRALETVISNTKVIEYKKERNWIAIKKQLKSFFKKGIEKIEAYDVSNIQGKQATGSAVVFIKGKPAKEYYRKFKIKMEEKPNDTAMIKEVLKRRLKHKEWPYPDLILIDGGRGQLNAALSAAVKIPVIALAKRENRLFFENKSFLLKNMPEESANMILHLRNEAHRFAISYHRKLRERELT